VKLDKQTALLLVALLGGGGATAKVSSDIADIRERVARIETRLDYAARVAQLEADEPGHE
jgi:hypothetical protein